jgi:hypothetical protein
MPPGGIRTYNPKKRVAADPSIRPRGHWKRQLLTNKGKGKGKIFLEVQEGPKGE